MIRYLINKVYIFIGFIVINHSLSAQNFIDVTVQANLPILPDLGFSGVFLDYNSDGYPDIFCYGGLTYLLKNNGDGTFTDVSATSGLLGVNPRSISVADFNGNGYPDLLIISQAAPAEIRIYKNNYGQQFELYDTLGSNYSRAIWIDINGNGKLDIFASRYSGGPKVFQNINNESFIDISNGMNLPDDSGATISSGDFNNDGFQDVYMGRRGGLNILFKNIAGAHFEALPPSAGVSDYRNTVSASWGDYNDDGYVDIYSGNFGSNRNVLFHNNGNGTFSDVTLISNVPDVGDARSATFVDYNNDGHLDIFTTNHVYPNRLYKNLGNGVFENVATSAGIANPQDGFAFSWADYDNDGDLDVFIVHHDGRNLSLLQNDGGNNNNWLFLKLQGTFDNRDGIGSKITAYFGNRAIYREVNAGSGYMGQDALPLHLGLDTSTIVDSIIINWPSGMAQKIFNIGANQKIEVIQEGNVPPTIFRLHSPQDSSLQLSDSVKFIWNSSVDPDENHPIEYTLIVKSIEGELILQTQVSDTNYTVTLNSLVQLGDTLLWYVIATDGEDIRQSWDTFHFKYSPLVGIREDDIISPEGFDLHNNYPNPFNTTTILRFDVSISSKVDITIYNSLGQKIKNVLSQNLSSGSYEALWNGLADNGNEVSSGMYFVLMKAYTIRPLNEVFTKSMKMVLIK